MQIHGHSRAGNTGWHDGSRERRQEDVKSTLLQMSLCPIHQLLRIPQWTFKMQTQLSFLKPSTDIWDSGQHALCRHRKLDRGRGGSLSAKGIVEEMLRTIIGHYISTREYFCHWTHVFHLGENALNFSRNILLKDKVVMQ